MHHTVPQLENKDSLFFPAISICPLSHLLKKPLYYRWYSRPIMKLDQDLKTTLETLSMAENACEATGSPSPIPGTTCYKDENGVLNTCVNPFARLQGKINRSSLHFLYSCATKCICQEATCANKILLLPFPWMCFTDALDEINSGPERSSSHFTSTSGNLEKAENTTEEASQEQKQNHKRDSGDQLSMQLFVVSLPKEEAIAIVL